MLKLRLTRIGRKRQPVYRLVVMQNTTRRDGRPIQLLGYYNPITKQYNFNSDKILFNGKIGVPIGGIEETLIIGDVQIDFILNEDGTLRAKVFNKENEFRYIGDELGYTQGIGLSYQVDFQTFRSLLSKIITNNN